MEFSTEVEVVKIIKSLKNKNSCGYDSLRNKMLKKEPYAFAKCLKTAYVIPIFKKGDMTNLNNYSPISLLPVLSKVFEKIINEQISKVVEGDTLMKTNLALEKATTMKMQC